MSYPHWWNETITLYNKYFDEDGIARYKRKVLTGCSYGKDIYEEDANGIKKLISLNILRIRKNPDYLNWIKWNEIEDKDETEKFTLNMQDIVVIGEVEDEIDEDTKGLKANDLLEKYKTNAFTIKDAKENVKVGLVHYKVIGE